MTRKMLPLPVEYIAELDRITPDLQWHSRFNIHDLKTVVAAFTRDTKRLLWYAEYEPGEEPHPILVVREFRQAISEGREMKPFLY